MSAITSKPSEGAWADCRNTLKKAGNCAQSTIETVVAVKDNSNELARVLKIAGYLFLAFQYITGKPALSILAGRLSKADVCIDSVQIFGDVNDCHPKKDLKEGNYGKFTFISCITAADTLGFFVWLEELGFIDIARWSAGAVARIPVLKYVVQIGLVAPIRFLVGVGFGAWFVVNLNKYKAAENNAQRNYALINMIWSASEVAFKIFALAGGMALTGVLGVSTILGFGLFCAGMGLLSFVYAKRHEKELKIGDDIAEHAGNI